MSSDTAGRSRRRTTMMTEVRIIMIRCRCYKQIRCSPFICIRQLPIKIDQFNTILVVSVDKRVSRWPVDAPCSSHSYFTRGKTAANAINRATSRAERQIATSQSRYGGSSTTSFESRRHVAAFNDRPTDRPARDDRMTERTSH